MKTLTHALWLANLLVAVSVTACKSDDDDGGSAGGLGSGVESDKPAEDLTDEEVEAICEAGADYFEDIYSSESFMKSACRFAAVFTGVTAPTESSRESLCESAYDLCIGCMEDPEAEGCEDFGDATVPEDSIDCAMAEVPDDCSSTAGELEACYRALLDQPSKMIADLPSCSEIDADTEAPSFNVEQEVPAACKTVEKNCPEFLG